MRASAGGTWQASAALHSVSPSLESFASSYLRRGDRCARELESQPVRLVDILGSYVEQPRRLKFASAVTPEEPAVVRDLTNVHVEEVARAATALSSTKSTTAVITARARARPVIRAQYPPSWAITRSVRPLLSITSAARADFSPQAAAIDATLGRSHRGAHEARHRAD